MGGTGGSGRGAGREQADVGIGVGPSGSRQAWVETMEQGLEGRGGSER
jgi:hypothetical protein